MAKKSNSSFQQINTFSLSTGIAIIRDLIKSDFVKKVTETFLTRIFLIPLSLITSVLIARILGPEGRGIYAVAFSILAISVQFGNLGLHSSNTYYVAKERSILPALLSNSLWVGFGFGLLLAGFTGIFLYFFPPFKLGGQLILVLALSLVPFHLSSMFLQNLVLGIQEVRLYNKIQLYGSVSTVTLLFLVIFLEWVTVEIIFVISTLAPVIGLFWCLYYFRKQLFGLFLPSYQYLKKGLGYGIKSYIACLFAFLVVRADILMINYMTDAEQTGYYSLSASLADFLYLLPTAVGTILFPKLSALKEPREIWRLTKKVSYLLTAVMIPLVIVAGLFGKFIIPFLYGKDFLPAVDPFLILCPAMLFYGVNNVISIYFASIGMPWFAANIWIFISLLNIGLNLILIPLYGIMGAAYASLFCYGLVMVTQFAYAIFKLGKNESQARL